MEKFMRENYKVGYSLVDGTVWTIQVARIPELRKQWALWLTRPDTNETEPLAYFRTEEKAEAAAKILTKLAYAKQG